jgi:hypothetical protein
VLSEAEVQEEGDSILPRRIASLLEGHFAKSWPNLVVDNFLQCVLEMLLLLNPIFHF